MVKDVLAFTGLFVPMVWLMIANLSTAVVNVLMVSMVGIPLIVSPFWNRLGKALSVDYRFEAIMIIGSMMRLSIGVGVMRYTLVHLLERVEDRKNIMAMIARATGVPELVGPLVLTLFGVMILRFQTRSIGSREGRFLRCEGTAFILIILTCFGVGLVCNDLSRAMGLGTGIAIPWGLSIAASIAACDRYRRTNSGTWLG